MLLLQRLQLRLQFLEDDAVLVRRRIVSRAYAGLEDSQLVVQLDRIIQRVARAASAMARTCSTTSFITR
jgi:hypothetical protein